MKKNLAWRIGCSGFHYKEWKDVFYPPKLAQRNWFTYYAERFNTLELNVSFYRFPRLGPLQQWYAASPANFLFSIKAPRHITHYKKFNNAEKMLDDFYTVADQGLGDKLGPVLFQLPPQVQYTEERLQLIIKSLRKEYTNVVEFRHQSWWQQPVYDALGKANISFCGNSHPTLPDDVIINTDTVYYRFHGVPDIFRSAYNNTFLEKQAKVIQQSKKVKTAYLYFNNTSGPAAIDNAGWMGKFVSS